MRRLALLFAFVLVLLFPSAAAAQAQTGHYTDGHGLTCHWFRYTDQSYDVSCSGYSRRLVAYYRYTCDIWVYTSTLADWRCRDMYGRTWQGTS